MVKKILFLSTILLFTLIPNLNVSALQVGNLRGLVITQEEDGTSRDYNLINDHFDYTENSTRYIFSNNYKLGMNLLGDTGQGYTEFTPKLSFYFTNPCQSNENINYNQKIAFFYRDGDIFPLNTINVVNNIDGCSGYWTSEGTTFYYNQTCSLNAGSFVLGSLYFTRPYIPYGSYTNYRIGIQNDFDVRCEVNNNAIIENNNSNTQNIINNNTNNTNQIIQNNEQNTQDIINNQNQNIQQEIESQKVCKTRFVDATDGITPGYLDNDGKATGTSSSTDVVTDYIYIKNATNFKNLLSNNTTYQYRLCFYNNNKTYLSCLARTSYNNSQNISIPNDAYYVRFTINKNTNRPTFSFDICQNGNQALNDSVNDLNDSITSTDTPNTNQDFNDMNDMVASFTPISDLIIMPLTLINAYINGIGATCSPVNLGSLLGTNLSIPCINIQDHIGSNLWNTIDILCCIFLCYEIAMLFISAFDGITSLRDDFEGLYQPKHAYTGYVPKHGGGN